MFNNYFLMKWKPIHEPPRQGQNKLIWMSSIMVDDDYDCYYEYLEDDDDDAIWLSIPF